MYHQVRLAQCLADVHYLTALDYRLDNLAQTCLLISIVDPYRDDAWVTDFRGGYTEGWVDKSQQGTVEGELKTSATGK